MTVPCEVVVRHLLPALRALIARELVEEHQLSQVAAARRLGITQAAVSQYLTSKRRAKTIEKLEADPEILRTAERIAEKIASTPETETPLNICSYCKTLTWKTQTIQEREE